MNWFLIISSLVLFGLSVLCFFLPYKSGKRITGLIAGVIFGVIITLTLIGNLDFLLIFIWLIILAFQIVFITYWIFRVYRKKRLGTILATFLSVIFLLVAMQPWITDWTFNNQDAQKILIYHGFELNDDFEILRNESGGFRDYYQTFTLKISDSDYQQIADKIKISNNYRGMFTDLTKSPSSNYRNNDTVDYETNYHFTREYFSKQKMDDGTFHFRFQLSKTKKELSYIGSNE